MRFIHAADIHLDSPFIGLVELPDEIKEPVFKSTFQAFERIVNAAIKDQVDFVLLVGDIFDTPKHSAAATDYFIRQLEKLDKAHIPVIMSFGNHDFRSEFTSMGLPSNVRLFGDQVGNTLVKTKGGQTVEISGFSYSQRWLTEDLISKFPDRGGADWYIGTWHGALATGTNDHYAPFKLNELLAKRYDYWALGHIHAPQQLNGQPPILYSGTPQGRNVNESGPHGYQLVESQDGRLVPHYHICSPIEWNTIEVNAGQDATVADLIVNIFSEFSKVKTSSEGTELDKYNANDVRNHDYVIDNQPNLRMITIEIAGSKLPSTVVQSIQSGSFLARLQEQVKKTLPLQWWPVACHFVDKGATQDFGDFDSSSWQVAAQTVFNSDTISTIADKLMTDPEIADKLEDPTTIQELKQRAMSLLKGGNADEN